MILINFAIFIALFGSSVYGIKHKETVAKIER